jgi:hypothetical protein
LDARGCGQYTSHWRVCKQGLTIIL